MNQIPVRWGLIGASDIADTRMIPAINARAESRVTAIYSHSPERAAGLANRHAIPTVHHELASLLADPQVDVIYISSTNEKHMAQTCAAAGAGKHILCEKPLALTLADAQQMVETCRAAGVVLGTNHHLRNAVTHRTLRRLIAEGAIGTPLAARVFHAVSLPPRLQGWRIHAPDAGGGVILDITVHDIDTLRFVLDDEVLEVTAFAARQGLAKDELEDAVMGVMQFQRGTLVQHHDAFTVPHARTGLEVHGTEGSLYAEDVMTQDPIGRLYLRRNGTREAVDTGAPEDLYDRAVRLFNSAAGGDGTPAATGEDGVRSLAVALAVLASTRSRQAESVHYPVAATSE
jgi:1,5-anhydro-D-fructose reductase (1,5-anhydro-D-mannitol-forming)